MKLHCLKYCVTILLAAGALASGAFAQIQIYVAPPPLGNDSTGVGSAGQPYATVGRAVTALNAAAAGSDILIAPGVYTENARHDIFRTGTPANPVEIKGNGGQPTLMQQSIALQGVNNVVVNNLNIDAYLAHPVCVYATAVQDCTITNVIATNSGSGGANDTEALSLGLRDRAGSPASGNFALAGGCQRLYYGSCSVPNATASPMFTIPDGPLQNSNVTLENCYFYEQTGGTGAGGGLSAFRAWAGVDGLVFKNTTIDAWQYAYAIDIRYGQNQSQGLTNRLTVEDSLFRARGGSGRSMYFSDAYSGCKNCVFRNSSFMSFGSLSIQFNVVNAVPTPSVFDNFQFYNCFLKDNLGFAPLDPAATGGFGTISFNTVSLVANNFGFHGCYFEGGLAVRNGALPSPVAPFDSWVIEDCTGLLSGQTFFMQGSPPLTNWLIRDCSFTALRCAAGAYKGQLQSSLIQDCTFITPNSARPQNADNGVFSLGGASGGAGPFLVCQDVTFRRCLFRSGRSDLPGFNLDHGAQSIGLTLEDCEIEAPQLAITATVNTSQQDLLLSNCTIRATTPGGRVVNLVFSGARNQTFQNCSFDGSGIAGGVLLGAGVLTPVDSGTTLSGCAISNVSGTAIEMDAGAGAVTIDGCTISNMTGNSSGIVLVANSLTADTTNAVIRNNWIQDVAGYAISVEGASHTLRGNTVVRAGLGGIRVRENPDLSQLSVSRPNRDVIVERNCLYGNPSPVVGSTGIEIGNPTIATANTNLRIVNNTLTLWEDGLVLGGANVRDVDLFNNIFSGHTGVALGVAGSGNTIGFNGYFSNGTNGVGVTVPGTGDVLGDPVFLSVTPGNANFLRLAPGSPMIDAGSLNGVIPDPTPDTGDDIDLGCFESGASAVSAWRLM